MVLAKDTETNGQVRRADVYDLWCPGYFCHEHALIHMICITTALFAMVQVAIKFMERLQACGFLGKPGPCIHVCVSLGLTCA